jgi:2-keto-myo-inositol isomerase
MVSLSQISLNRIISPGLNLEQFFKLGSEIGVNKVELRNDLPGTGIIDSYLPDQVKRLSENYGIDILTINALQQFNLGAVLPDVLKELKELIDLSGSIGCEAVVLVPNNDRRDKRAAETMFKETAAALRAFAPLFEAAGIFGYVEPLGFAECSLRSKAVAVRAIRESGGKNYKIVHDTFHHYLGPDTTETLQDAYDISHVGLVHLSGVTAHMPADQYTDDHRILITEQDRLQNREQIEQLVRQGYRGNFSFEPFSGDVQQMGAEALKGAVSRSIDLIVSEITG